MKPASPATTRFVMLTRLLVIVALMVEAAAAWLLTENPEWMPGLRVIHLLQITLLIALSVGAMRQLANTKSHWAWQAKWVVIALAFAIVGDIINSGLIDFSAVTDQRHLLSIPAFAIMQAIYVFLFWRSSSVAPEHSASDSISNFKLVGLVFWLPLSVVLWFAVFDSHMPTLIERATLFYVCLVTLMGVTSTWIWRVWGDIGSWVTAGALLFMVSDALIGVALNNGGVPTGIATHLVWITYITAQCLIARMPLLGQAMEDSIPDYPEGFDPETGWAEPEK